MVVAPGPSCTSSGVLEEECTVQNGLLLVPLATTCAAFLDCDPSDAWILQIVERSKTRVASGVLGDVLEARPRKHHHSTTRIAVVAADRGMWQLREQLAIPCGYPRCCYHHATGSRLRGRKESHRPSSLDLLHHRQEVLELDLLGCA